MKSSELADASAALNKLNEKDEAVGRYNRLQKHMGLGMSARVTTSGVIVTVVDDRGNRREAITISDEGLSKALEELIKACACQQRDRLREEVANSDITDLLKCE